MFPSPLFGLLAYSTLLSSRLASPAGENGSYFLTTPKNVPIQNFTLGLDFEKDATSVLLDICTYIAVHVPHTAAISWKDLCYDADTDTIIWENPAVGEEAYTLPYNTNMFRVSNYRE